jgi:hypothetical protein
VPILDAPECWDAEALNSLIAYRGGQKQVWVNTTSAAFG